MKIRINYDLIEKIKDVLKDKNDLKAKSEEKIIEEIKRNCNNKY